MASGLEILAFALEVTGPILAILGLGWFLRRRGAIDTGFVDAGSRLVFHFALPALLFISIVEADPGSAENLSLIGYALVATAGAYLLFELVAARMVWPASLRGVVVQGALRSNLGIVGLAYCANAYGQAGLAAGALFMGPVTILLNVLAVVTLSRSLGEHRGLRANLIAIAANPLILAILMALLTVGAEVRIPDALMRTGEYLARMTLPLALLCIGASLDWRGLRASPRHALLAALGKLLIVPLLFAGGGYLAGFRGMDLGILFLMAVAPTSAASFVMTRAMGGDDGLAANIIALTTLGSIMVASLGVILLRGGGMM